MPDGDKVHEGLAGQDQKVYMKLCEGHCSPEELVEDEMKSVQKKIEIGGDSILQMIQKVAVQLDNIFLLRWCGTIDWRQEITRIDALERSTRAHAYYKKLAYDACREVLESVRQGNQPSNSCTALLTAYYNQIYTAGFEERVPFKKSHYNGVSQEFVAEQLEQMRPFAEARFQSYAESVDRNGTVHLPREPAGPRRTNESKPRYDVGTDISEIMGR